MKNLLLAMALISSLLLSACDYIPLVYKIDIKQGNIIDQEMIDQLRPNMTKRQVLYVMGSPMLNDYFHKQRWDYVYSVRENGAQTIHKRAALFFDGDALVRIEGDFKPGSGTAPAVKESSITVLPRHLEKTLWEKITGLFDWSSEDSHTAQSNAVPDEFNNIPVKKF